ncbi:serine-protein kinase RsbW [Mycobacterium heckeshornense]|uniref:SpoIIE family protein phosphatase n=1 Tax=Mycobacterium heckeshornense TaxID=110505 RepID=UPI001940D3CF|nr:SpoIIE family protein phosphatase [Mycobacterium heckeshornense]BCQ07734.1 serine-protein kinase RsbW [Mycobacterium heckeshornense]
MTDPAEFHARYADALRAHLQERGEASLAVGHELGRQALQHRISMLDIIENHFQLVGELSKNSHFDAPAALHFLLQTLAALDVATRGFLDSARRYEEQRARADRLADRDEFRSALVNSLQEGFFVADHRGAVIEINDAFGEITGYAADGLPYRWPHPWLVDRKTANHQQALLVQGGSVAYETPIRHRDGHLTWVAVSMNAVTEYAAEKDVYVGTIRDITAQRAFAARESAVLRLATAVSVAKNVDEVLSITLDECRMALDVQRVIAVMWPTNGGEPTIRVAGEPAESSWRELDPLLRQTFETARNQLPLTVQTVEWADTPGKSRGVIAVLSGAGDVALWLELRVPRWISAEDRLLVTVLVGHLGLAIQHVRQFEIARNTSLTLQRAMLPSMQPPAGFAVRYEPAVPPLEIGGDWYDVLSLDENRIGIVVGDCVGRGLPAAAVMGQLRSSARALLLTGAEPALLLEDLDAAAEVIPGAYCTTVFLAILDSKTGLLRYSNAGHMPALFATRDAGTTLLAEARSVPLAVHRDHPRPQASQVLPPGSTLIVFTDGLIERKRESIDAGIARVAKVLTDTMDLPVDHLADAVLRELAPAAGYDDDVAMVVYRCPQAALRLETGAAAAELADVRDRLTAWLESCAVPGPLIADVVLAVYEACANSAEHAYRGLSTGQVRVDVDIAGGEIRARVADSGSWKTPPPESGPRGQGLKLINAVSDRVELDSGESGTTITMSFRLPSAPTN